jgi:4-hydroxy-tetrahydrodipicolinate synthase
MTDSNGFIPHGVFAAALTPLAASLEPDREALIEHGKWLLGHGCDGLAILGSTGEANCLTLDQRLDVIGYAADELPAEKLLVGTGACSVSDAITLTGSAVTRGLVNVLVLPPFYYRPVSDAGVFRYYEMLIDSVADTNLRIYLYNFPQMTGFSFSSELIGKLRDRFGAVIAGMKDSSGDWAHMSEICVSQPGFDVFAGTETFLLDILKVGGVGCISATANVTSAMCQQVYQAWLDKDEPAAEILQERLSATRAALQAFPAVPSLKALMARTPNASNAHWQNLLPPFTGLDANAVAELQERLDGLKFQGPGLPGPGLSAAA